MKILYEPKSKRFPEKVLVHLADCSCPTPMIDFSQYFAPISVYQGAMKIAVENEALKAVQQIGVSVDKEELLKALANDRKQYEHGYIKGYQAGYEANKWISVDDELPEDGVDVLVWRDGCFAIAHIICGDDWTYTGIGGDPVCWCPLPRPPEEV